MNGDMTDHNILGACPHDCPDTCALLVTVREGRAVAVRGNPEHPLTRGGLCVKVNNYPERVYSPDRVLHPLRRVGPKGEGRFERISWEAALEEIRARWQGIIADWGPTAILPYSYLGTQGILNGMAVGDAFFNRLGASISERTFCGSGATTAWLMTVGPTPGIDPESFVHSRFILLWACNTISTNLHHWPVIAEARRRGATVVVIDPVKSRTAKAADWHVAPRPGTDGVLALGLIQVIVTEDLVDHDYVARHTLGFEALAARARAFPPERVEALTGVPAEEVRRLARAYATSQPAVIRLGVAVERHPGGGNAVRAIASLPALTGAWRRVGGGILQMTFWAFPVKSDVIMRPDWIRGGTRIVNQWQLGAALTGELGLDPPIRSLMVYNANPAIVIPEQEKVLRGLAREDLFTIVSEHFVTDTARYADLVLPATTQLEQLDLMDSWGHFYLTLNQPAIAPLGEAVPNTELFRRLARAMGMEDPRFRLSDEELLEAVIDWDAPALAGIDLALLRRQGFARLSLGTADSYAPHAEGNFPTPSGKCEFVAARGENFVLPSYRQGSTEFQPEERLDPLPDFLAPEEPTPDYPLSLVSPKAHPFINSCYGNLPQQRHHAGEQPALLHPSDARARGIAEGQPVAVFNARGRVPCVARVTEDVLPGVVVVPLGYWMEDGRARTVNALHPDDFADYGRAPRFSGTRVEVLPLG